MKRRIPALLLSIVLSLSLLSTAFAMDPVDWDNSNTAIGPQGPSTSSTVGGGDVSGGVTNWDYGSDYDYIPSYDVGSSNGSNRGGSWTTNRSSANAGETVTITVTPNAGMRGVPSVTDKNGKDVPVNSLGNNRYSFTMPVGGVNISVAFESINPFWDVVAGEFYYDAVLWAVELGITDGATPTTFSPDDTCTRAEIVTFLWRAAGKPEPTTTWNRFYDVPAGEYYYKAVLWAAEQGITDGTDPGVFSPDDTCTRAEAMTFLWRADKMPPSAGFVNPFIDVPGTEYYSSAVQWAVNKPVKVTEGTTYNTFSPDEHCTRAEIVTFLWRDRTN